VPQRRHIAGVKLYFPVKARAVVAGQALPIGQSRIPSRSRRHVRTRREIIKRRLVRRNQSGPGAGLGRHIAHCHSALHGEIANGCTGIFNDMPRRPRIADAGNDGKDQVLGRGARRERAIHPQAQGRAGALPESLRRQDMRALGQANAKRQCTKRAVGRGVGIAAGDQRTG